MLATSGCVALKPTQAGSPKVNRASCSASRQTIPARNEMANKRSASCRKKTMPAMTRGKIAGAPAHPAVLLAATQGRGVLRSTDSGATWTSAITGIDSAWIVRFDPLQPATAYAGTQTAGFYKSVDEGKTWIAQNQGLTSMDVRSIAVASGLVLAGTAQGVYSSIDGGASWHSLGLESLDIAAVAILPSATSSTVFAGADNGTAGSGLLLQIQRLGGRRGGVKGDFPGGALGAPPPGGSAPP